MNCHDKGEAYGHQNACLKKSREVEAFLIQSFRLDQKILDLIINHLTPLLLNQDFYPILDSFIGKVKKLTIPFNNSVSSPELLPDDALIKAPRWHTVLFESRQVRILRGVVKCGEHVPYHLHQWDRLMIVIRGGKFKSEDTLGQLEFDDIPVGVYESQGERSPVASTNIGSTLFEALVFEIKR